MPDPEYITYLAKNKHPRCKVTLEQVVFIRNSLLSGVALAAIIGIKTAQISAIRTGKAWKHVA